MEWFYDKHGSAVVFEYGNRLISKTGENLCWIINDKLYSLKKGRHIGWFEKGKIYDIENGILAFTREASGLPYIPGLSGTPGVPGIPGTPGRPGIGASYARSCYFGFTRYNSVIEYFKNNE